MITSNQLQNHAKFITVHGRCAGGQGVPHTIHEQWTMDHEINGVLQ